MTDEDRDTFWQYINTMNRCAYGATGRSLPHVPTREEITANIRSNKRTVDESEQLSVTRAFQSSLASSSTIKA